MDKSKRFSQHIVIVTGASSGIGLATAIAFAKQGACVVLAARTQHKLEVIADEIKQFNANVRVVPADLTSQAQIDHLINTTLSAFGRIDILINNAGIGATGGVEHTDFIADVQRIFELSYLGKVACVRAVLPSMRLQRKGYIVNISSIAGRKALPMMGAYGSVQHAISAFSDSLRQELHSSGIRVLTVYLGLVQTPFFDTFRVAELPTSFYCMAPYPAEQVAEKIISAVYKRQTRVVMPWQAGLLILADVFSEAWSDAVVKLLSNPLFTRLIGLYRGRGLRVPD